MCVCSPLPSNYDDDVILLSSVDDDIGNNNSSSSSSSNVYVTPTTMTSRTQQRAAAAAAAASSDADVYVSREHAETILRQMATLYAARQVRSDDVYAPLSPPPPRPHRRPTIRRRDAISGYMIRFYFRHVVAVPPSILRPLPRPPAPGRVGTRMGSYNAILWAAFAVSDVVLRRRCV